MKYSTVDVKNEYMKGKTKKRKRKRGNKMYFCQNFVFIITLSRREGNITFLQNYEKVTTQRTKLVMYKL